jgi:hypothetical protein
MRCSACARANARLTVKWLDHSHRHRRSVKTLRTIELLTHENFVTVDAVEFNIVFDDALEDRHTHASPHLDASRTAGVCSIRLNRVGGGSKVGSCCLFGVVGSEYFGAPESPWASFFRSLKYIDGNKSTPRLISALKRRQL